MLWLRNIYETTTVYHLTSSFWHFASTSSLERQEIQTFLFLPLLLVSSALRLKKPVSSRVQERNCWLVTLPCFHSSCHGQQQTAWNGITTNINAPKLDNGKIYISRYYTQTYLQSIYNFRSSTRIYNSKFLKSKREQRWRPRKLNARVGHEIWDTTLGPS